MGVGSPTGFEIDLVFLVEPGLKRVPNAIEKSV